jgi:hypothetical protein
MGKAGEDKPSPWFTTRIMGKAGEDKPSPWFTTRIMGKAGEDKPSPLPYSAAPLEVFVNTPV